MSTELILIIGIALYLLYRRYREKSKEDNGGFG